MKTPDLARLSIQNMLKTADSTKTAAPPMGRVRSFLHTLAGRNIDKALAEQHQKIMELPFVARYAKDYPKDMGTFESYVRKALRGDEKMVPGLADLSVSARRSKGRQALIAALEGGQGAVRAERAAALRARLGLGSAVTLPAGGFAAGAAMSKTSADVEDIAPAAAAGAAGSIPAVQGLRSGALGLPEPKGRAIKNVEKLREALQPGDILMTSKPGLGSKFKAPIAFMGGDPYGYHVESVTGVPKRSKGVHFIHSTPSEGGAAPYFADLEKKEDVIIKRFKDKALAKKYLENLKKFEGRENILEHMLGEYPRAKMYDTRSAIRGGLKSFLPGPLKRLAGSSAPEAGATICSTLPGLASPVCLAPGVAKHEIMPHHIQRSPALETVGHYRAPRTGIQKGYEHILRGAPWALRGALGAGLGYGAYKGVKALFD